MPVVSNKEATFDINDRDGAGTLYVHRDDDRVIVVEWSCGDTFIFLREEVTQMIDFFWDLPPMAPDASVSWTMRRPRMERQDWPGGKAILTPDKYWFSKLSLTEDDRRMHVSEYGVSFCFDSFVNAFKALPNN